MDPELSAIAEDLARRADDFLAGVRDRPRARAAIAEELALEHGWLDPDARTAIVDGVIELLAEEDFFGIEFVGDPFDEPEEPEE